MRFFFLFFLLLVPSLAVGMEDTPSPSLEYLVNEALENNPELHAMKNQWKMNVLEIPQAESLEDPVLSLGLNNLPIDSFAADESPMTGRSLSLTQKFPFPGKLATRGEIAEQKAQWFEAAYNDAKLQLVEKVKEAFYRIYYLDRAVTITRKNIGLLDDFTRLAETKYEVGKGLQQDVLKAQVERSRMLDRLTSLKQKRVSAVARLNTLLDRPPGAELAALEEIEVKRVELPVDELQDLSEQNRPLYSAYRSLVERFKAERKLARLDYYPDFNVGTGYTYREETPGNDGTDFFGLQFSMNLPVYQRKREAAVAQANSGIRMAMHRYENFKNEVFFNIEDAYANMEKNYTLVQLYQTGILPQAGQAYESAVSAYQVGSVDFLTLLDSLIKLYEDNIEYYRLVSDFERNVARLEAQSGVEVEESDSHAASRD